MNANPRARWWPAPAKLNLCLHVTGRRADGYHDLQTIFQLISLSDQLSFDLREDGRIVRLDYEGSTAQSLRDVAEDQDLCVRAARALQTRSGVTAGVIIRIRKTIPVVTHEMNFARRVADRVVFMHQGKVWEQGPAEQIFAEPRTDALRQFLSSVLH